MVRNIVASTAIKMMTPFMPKAKPPRAGTLGKPVWHISRNAIKKNATPCVTARNTEPEKKRNFFQTQ